MIEEDYVSFDTAKLLKEKGFDGKCRARYGTAGSFSYEKYEIEASDCETLNAILEPTIQMTVKWLRKVCKIHIMVDCIGSENYIPTIQFTHSSKDIMLESKKSKMGGNGFDSYEEACEEAIKYCLEKLV